MKPSSLIALSSSCLVVISYAIIFYAFKDTGRFDDYYYIEGTDSIKSVFISEVNKRSTTGISNINFFTRPILSDLEKKKWNITPKEYVKIDSLIIDNRFYRFDCGIDGNKMLVSLHSWEYPSEYKRYYMYDGRRNQCEDIWAAWRFRKDFLSKLGIIHKDEVYYWIHIYAEFFLWNQLYIYLFLAVLWLSAKLTEWRHKKKIIDLQTIQRRF